MSKKAITSISIGLVFLSIGLSVFIVFFHPNANHRGLDVSPNIEQIVQAVGPQEVPGDIDSLKTTYRTINLINSYYLDSTRIDWKKMLEEAVRAFQTQISSVLVKKRNDSLVVECGPKQQTFALNDATSPWILLKRLSEAFEFIKRNVDESTDIQELEYSVINSMLKTLDPHTTLLTPNMYRDMKDKTQGKFGGLGIVISIREGDLTIISPLDDTPAAKVGLKAGDKIVKIGESSTINMPLNDAVKLMRGTPGTKVTLAILREGWIEPRDFEITRAIIQVRSVESELLSQKVGYVRITDFQSNTARDLKEHLGKLNQKGIKGLVLDLRNNPGGLLTAAIQVSDVFLKKGVIVTTAGQSPSERDVKRGRNGGDEPSYPIAILVNSGSASASEIVAGALKNHGRALLVGERTFGKGSVQVLYDFHDGSALKMTTAQYLTPGDLSIQSVGVVPHVELAPWRADEKMLDLKSGTIYREADLKGHFEENNNKKKNKIVSPSQKLHYLWKPEEKDEKEAAKKLEDPKEPFKADFPIELAQDLVLEMAATATPAKVATDSLVHILKQRSATEEAKLVKALKKLGIDWQNGQADGPSTISVSAQIQGDEVLKANDTRKLEVSVTNTGTHNLYRLHGLTKCDLYSLDGKEFVFGMLEPGQTIVREVEFKLAANSYSQTNDILFKFSDSKKQAFDSIALRFSVEELPKPRFASAYQMILPSGEPRADAGADGGADDAIKLVVDVENVGAGKALSAFATLKSLSGKDIFLSKGRYEMGEINPKERKQVIFEFQVKPHFKDEHAKFELALLDLDLKTYSAEKMILPIKSKLSIVSHGGVYSTRQLPAPVFEFPFESEKQIASIISNQPFRAIAKSENYVQVKLDKTRTGWVPISQLTPLPTATPVDLNSELLVYSSPNLLIEPLPLVVKDTSLTIKGVATDEQQVRDVYIYVGKDKVFFKPNTNPNKPGELPFEATVTLENGLNYISVVAEENSTLDVRKTFTIRKDREDGMSFIQNKDKIEPLGVIPTVN